MKVLSFQLNAIFFSLNLATALIMHYENGSRIPCLNEQNHGKFSGLRGLDITCPYMCVWWTEMCRGIHFCDAEVKNCGPELECPLLDADSGGRDITLSVNLILMIF